MDGTQSQTSARILDGKALARRISQALAEEVRSLAKTGTTPHLVLCQLRDDPDPAALAYVGSLRKACAATGIRFTPLRIPAHEGYARVERELHRLNDDASVSGIILQTPLPEGLNLHRIQGLIRPDKDVERVNPTNIGLVVYEKPHLAPCTAMAAMELVRSSGVPIKGKEAVIVGHSKTVGKPLALLLLDELATITICHAETRDLTVHTRRADILTVAVGRPRLIRGSMIKPGAIVIDIGFNKEIQPDGSTRFVGDVDFDEACKVAGWLTPVPGGVGAVNTAMVLRNTLRSAQKDPLW
jgi:methylenetetrahydrofolate dehydrogenase (NADP+)/methenyltetrahydrofolate cyclohydrolase